jgi:phosphoribosylglycinamide formyltransferase-1
MTLHLGWFSTGRDEAARNLLSTVHRDLEAANAPARVKWIFCHRTPGDGPENPESLEREKFFALARDLGIPVKTASHVKFEPEMRRRGVAESPTAAEASPLLLRWRDMFGREVLKAIASDPVDIVIMAGYMLIVGEPELSLNLVNIHPALPWGPRGTWQEVIHQLLRERADEQGIMIHLVTKELDRGPVISYCRFRIQGGDWAPLWKEFDQAVLDGLSEKERETLPLFRRIRKTGEVRELPLLSLAIQELAFGRLEVRNHTIFSHGLPQGEGVDLTDRIETIVAGRDGASRFADRERLIE